MKKFCLIGLSALAAACGATPANLSGELVFETTALQFGVVGIASTATLPLGITNEGTASVGVLSLTLTEGAPTDWTIDRNGVDAVAPGTTAEILVSFRPIEQHAYAGLLLVRTDGASTEVTLDGSGGPSTADDDLDGHSIADGDCDDGNDAVHPGAPEICNGIDDDCDGGQLLDEVDADRDGWLICEGDCDDLHNTVRPNAEEICDQLDNNCDNDIPDDVDADNDGFTLCTGDCDDAAFAVNPGRVEVCDNGVDNDCDGGIDDIDEDGDGFSTCSEAGDCDDDDPAAHPVVVATTGTAAGLGTDLSPVNTIATALSKLDTVCRTVIVEAGTYTNVGEVWPGGTVYIEGRTGDPADVTLTAANNDRHFTVSGGATLSLSGLTLQNGSPVDEDGGAIFAQNGTVELESVLLTGNTSDTDGGAVAISSGVLSIGPGTRFENNVALDDGGAVALNGGVLDDTEGTVYLLNSGSDGGAIYAVGGTFTLANAELRANAAAGGGGAVALYSAGTYVLENNWFTLDTSGTDGGALLASDVSGAGSTVRNNRFQDNTADAGGGAIAALGATASFEIANNTITGSIAVADEGSGILVGAVDAAGLTVTANVLHSSDGASAVYATLGSAAIATYNTVWLTNSGIDFGGAFGDGAGDPLDLTNAVRNPLLVALSDDGVPDNDNLALQNGSPEIDSGPPLVLFDDPDGSTNDRGHTGGPASDP